MSESVLNEISNPGKPAMNREFEVALGRWFTYFVCLMMMVGSALAMSMLIPQALDAGTRVAEFEAMSNPQAGAMAASYRSLQSSSWTLALVSFAMLPLIWTAFYLATRRKYIQSWLSIGTCIGLFILSAIIFKPI